MDAPLRLLHPIIEVVGAAMHEYGIAEIRHGGYCIHRTAESVEVPPNEATNSESAPGIESEVQVIGSLVDLYHHDPSDPVRKDWERIVATLRYWKELLNKGA